MTQSSRPAGQDDILARLNDRMNVLENELREIRAGQQVPAPPPDLAPFQVRLSTLMDEVRAVLALAQEAEARRAQAHQAGQDALAAATANLTRQRAALDQQAQDLQREIRAALSEFRVQAAEQAGELTNRANEAEARLGRAITAVNLLTGKGGTA